VFFLKITKDGVKSNMKKRILAFFIMLIIIASSIYIGQYRSLFQIREGAQGIFDKQIQPYLDYILEAGYELTAFSGDYEALGTACEHLKAAQTAGEKYAAYMEVFGAAASGPHESEWFEIIMDAARNLKVKEYNDAVKEYNNIIEKMPFNIVGATTMDEFK